MELSQLFHFDTNNKQVQQYLKAGLFPLVATVNGRRCMIYVEGKDGLIYGSTESPTEETPPAMTIDYKSSDETKLQDFNDQLDGLKKHAEVSEGVVNITVKYTANEPGTDSDR